MDEIESCYTKNIFSQTNYWDPALIRDLVGLLLLQKSQTLRDIVYLGVDGYLIRKETSMDQAGIWCTDREKLLSREGRHRTTTGSVVVHFVEEKLTTIGLVKILTAIRSN